MKKPRQSVSDLKAAIAHFKGHGYDSRPGLTDAMDYRRVLMKIAKLTNEYGNGVTFETLLLRAGSLARGVLR